jgi:hypothetical protein
MVRRAIVEDVARYNGIRPHSTLGYTPPLISMNRARSGKSLRGCAGRQLVGDGVGELSCSETT